MDGNQQKARGAKPPTSRPHPPCDPQSSPIQLPSNRQQQYSTPSSLPSKRPQSHSTYHSVVKTPEFQSSSSFDYDESTMPTSSLLNQLLKEKKASQLQNRLGKRHASEFDAYKRLPHTSPSDPAGPGMLQSSSLGPSGSGSSHGRAKEMGAREMIAVSSL